MITPGLAAELGLLTQALDLPGTDMAETLRRLAADARTAVASYLGLSVAITAEPSPFEESPFDLTVLDEAPDPVTSTRLCWYRWHWQLLLAAAAPARRRLR